MLRCFLHYLSLATLLLTASGGVNATELTSDYPNKPIHLVVPYAPGGITNALAHMIAQKMSAKLGQPVVVENKPGAGTIMGTSFVARRPADGYTVLLTTAAFLINTTCRDDMPYDSLKEFSLIAAIAKGPAVLAVNPSVPAETLEELVVYAKKYPDKLSYGSSGFGGFPQLAVELLKTEAKIDLLHIPYNGSAPAARALVDGQTSAGIDGVMLYLSQIRAGNLRPLAVTSKDRVSLLPTVPTMAESGFPDYDLQAWWGALVVSGTSSEILELLSKTFIEILATEEMKEFFEGQALEVIPESPIHDLENETARWANMVRASGMRAQ